MSARTEFEICWPLKLVEIGFARKLQNTVSNGIVAIYKVENIDGFSSSFDIILIQHFNGH